MIKNFIRRYPGYALIVIGCQLFLIAAFLAVIFFSVKTIDTLRTSGEVRYTAAFLSDMRDMESLAEDSTIRDAQKRLMLYQKAHSAVESLTETGYTETVKRTITEALNGISRHLLENNGEADELLLNEKELDFLHLFGNQDIEAACEAYLSRINEPAATEETITAELRAFRFSSVESLDAANRLFGVNRILTEWKSPTGRERIFSCKNAYAVINAGETYPLEAAIFIPFRNAVYTTAECRAFAESFITDVYPKKIYRTLSLTGETDFPDRVEVVFTGKGNRTVTVGISKATGRMISLETTGLTQKA